MDIASAVQHRVDTKACHLFAAVVVMLLISFGVLEILTRVLFADRRFANELLHSSGPLETFNADLGWALNPAVLQRVRTTDNELITYRTNTYGFRVEELGEQARGTEDTPAVDVLFVGNSITFGTSANTSYPAEFSRASHLAVINAGVPGYGTDQAFLMTKRAIEAYALNPKAVVYGFYYNDAQNNLSDLSIHGEAGVVIHKPVLDLRNSEYRKAQNWKNDVTIKYAEPGAMEAFLLLASQSKFLRGAGRVLKYDALARLSGTPLFEFDQLAQSYLKGNLDHFVAYLRIRNIRFVVLHIAGGRRDLDLQLATYLKAYCQTQSIPYIRPDLEATDYLRTDPHLSDQGARHVAEALWKNFR